MPNNFAPASTPLTALSQRVFVASMMDWEYSLRPVNHLRSMATCLQHLESAQSKRLPRLNFEVQRRPRNQERLTLIYRRRKNLQAVQLLGHTKLENTVHYLGIEVDDALERRSRQKFEHA
jgi:hypothetical protein